MFNQGWGPPSALNSPDEDMGPALASSVSHSLSHLRLKSDGLTPEMDLPGYIYIYIHPACILDDPSSSSTSSFGAGTPRLLPSCLQICRPFLHVPKPAVRGGFASSKIQRSALAAFGIVLLIMASAKPRPEPLCDRCLRQSHYVSYIGPHLRLCVADRPRCLRSSQVFRCS